MNALILLATNTPPSKGGGAPTAVFIIVAGFVFLLGVLVFMRQRRK
jgi:hypothetical protein